MACDTVLPVPVDCPIVVYIGATFGPFLVLITDEATGDPFDLSGYGVRAEVRANPQYPTVYFDLLPIITDAASGSITIKVPDAVTVTLAPMECVWDLILISPVGERLGPFVGGKATIVMPVSRTP